MSTPPVAAKTLTTQEILDKSMKRALGGGVAGATAMFVNVGTLMWMRTTINYQLRHGGGTMDAFRFVCVAIFLRIYGMHSIISASLLTLFVLNADIKVFGNGLRGRATSSNFKYKHGKRDFWARRQTKRYRIARDAMARDTVGKKGHGFEVVTSGNT